MTKPIVVLIHGMGNHTAPKPTSNERGSFGTECIDTFNTAFQMYPSLQSSRIEDSVNFVEIHYNHLFDTFRNEMAENGQKFEDLLKGAGATTPLGNVPGLVQAVIGFEASLDSDDVFFTHWLDVILYKLYFGEVVRIHVAKKLGDIITKNNTKDIHILAHSLGTAVIHDTLAKVYRHDYADDDEIADLAPVTHKLASIWQIANISRLANSLLKIADPYKSLIKPGSKGVTSTMMNIHHKLDPFTLLQKFSRLDNGNWIPPNVYSSSYRDIETSDITQINTHSITQYLHDPDVHLYLFKRLGIRIPPKGQREKASNDYKNMIIDGAVAELKSQFEEVTKGNAATFKDYFVAAKKLVDATKRLGA
jgi:hypothetical protein